MEDQEYNLAFDVVELVSLSVKKTQAEIVKIQVETLE